MANKPDHPKAALPWRAVIGLVLMFGSITTYAVMNFISIDVATLFKAFAVILTCILVFLCRNALRRVVFGRITKRPKGSDVNGPKVEETRPIDETRENTTTSRPADVSKETDDGDFDPSLFVPPKSARKNNRNKKIEALKDHPRTPENERMAAERKLNNQ